MPLVSNLVFHQLVMLYVNFTSKRLVQWL